MTSPSPTSPQSNVASPVVVFTTSGLGGIFGWIVVHPANTLAVRWNLSTMQPGSKPFSVRGMIQEHGWMSLYDGLSAGIFRQVFYATSRFGLFETFRDKLHEIRGKTDFTSRYSTFHPIGVYCF
jgi:solute carrier family 25 oxoglutarate transporter 11